MMPKTLPLIALILATLALPAQAQEASTETSPAAAVATSPAEAPTASPDAAASPEVAFPRAEGADTAQRGQTADAGGRPEVPTIGMYLAARDSDRDDLKQLLNIYIGGLSDGFYSYERAMQRRGEKRYFCYGSLKDNLGGPSRPQAVATFEDFSQLMLKGAPNQVVKYPIMTTFSVHYRHLYRCSEDSNAIEIDSSGVGRLRPLLALPRGNDTEKRSDNVPTMGMFWAAEVGEDLEKKSQAWLMLMAYIKGVSDGVFALDHARLNRFKTRNICYELESGHGLPPTREESADVLRDFMFKMLDKLDEQKVNSMPISIVMPQAMMAAYSCK